MFRNREDAAYQLAELLTEQSWRDPLVLGIPRGGVVIGAILAQELDAELDVVLSRKLRAPGNPELALGAIGENGEVFLQENMKVNADWMQEYVNEERSHQAVEIERRRRLFRQGRPPAKLAGRSVIITDDGIATGSTMIAALHVARTQEPAELIVAVPVGAPDRLALIRSLCDDLFCVHTAPDLYAIGQFYGDFHQIEDDEVVALLRSHQLQGDNHT